MKELLLSSIYWSAAIPFSIEQTWRKQNEYTKKIS